MSLLEKIRNIFGDEKHRRTDLTARDILDNPHEFHPNAVILAKITTNLAGTLAATISETTAMPPPHSAYTLTPTSALRPAGSAHSYEPGSKASEFNYSDDETRASITMSLGTRVSHF